MQGPTNTSALSKMRKVWLRHRQAGGGHGRWHCISMGSRPLSISTKKERPDASLFIGAGDRTRTGTPSLAADFEGMGNCRIWWNTAEHNGTIRLAKHTKRVSFCYKKFEFYTKTDNKFLAKTTSNLSRFAAIFCKLEGYWRDVTPLPKYRQST